MFDVYLSRDVRRENFNPDTADTYRVLQVMTNAQGTFFLVFIRGHFEWLHSSAFVSVDFKK